MRPISVNPWQISLAALLALPLSTALSAQQVESPRSDITVTGVPAEEVLADLPAGPEIKGIISARRGDRVQITTADGAPMTVAINQATQIKASSGLFGGNRNALGKDALLNGLPVAVKTLQGSSGLIARQITYKNNDFKMASMIRNGTAQRFDEQTAATEALRGRVGDIDNYNIKGTTNVNFDTGKAVLSPQAKSELCAAASNAEGMNNALILVVGYTDSVGSEEYNQTLSERRASSVINYLQQACRWKPYRMLTPTGMSEADPMASNDTDEGKAQNRRVAVNILVSKGLDGL